MVQNKFSKERAIKKKIVIVNMFFFVLGIVLFIHIIVEAGINNLINKINEIGYSILIVFIGYIFLYVFQSLSWWFCIDHKNSNASFYDILIAKISGWAISEVVPLNSIAGETFKAYKVRDKIKDTNIVSSLFLYNVIHALTTFSMLIVALIILMLFLNVGLTLKIFSLCILIIILLIIFIIYKHKNKGLLTGICLLLMKFSFFKRKLSSKIKKVIEIDRQIKEFWRTKKKNFIFSYLFQWSAKILEMTEIFILMILLSYPISFFAACLSFAMINLFYILMFFIPSQIGIIEAGMNRLFNLIGYSAKYGTMVGVIRRIRVIFWIALGLLIIFITGLFSGKKVLTNNQKINVEKA